MPADLAPELVARELAGAADAQRHLITALTPMIQWNVAKMLRRWRTGPAASRNLHQEVEDLVQEVFLELFEDDGKTLARWDPERLPLEAYVGYIAKIRTAEVLRSRRSPWREDPSPGDDIPRPPVEHTPEDDALSHDQLRKVHLCLLAGFKPDDLELFELLFLRQSEPEAAASMVGKSLAAVYKWRSRLYERARLCREKLSRQSFSQQRDP